MGKMIFHDGTMPEDRMIVGCGAKFKDKDGNVYILAQVASKRMALIDTDSGNRWSDFVDVKLPTSLTRAEFFSVANGEVAEFEIISPGKADR